MNSMLKLIWIILCLLSLGRLWSQSSDYVEVRNVTGIEWSQNQYDAVNAVSGELNDLLPTSIQADFKVYGAGFYIQQRNYEGSYPSVYIDIQNEYVDPTSDFYLLIGAGVIEGLGESEWFIDFKLPEDGDFLCLTAEMRQSQKVFLKEYAKSFPVGVSYYEGTLALINKFKRFVNVVLNCECEFADPNCEYSQFDKDDESLLGLGFRKRQIAIGSKHTWEQGDQGIFDYSGIGANHLSVIIEGQEYYIPDQIKEAKEIFDGSTIELEDTVLSIDLHGEVFIFDETSFHNDSLWEAAIAASSSQDYVEYWVILEEPNTGKSYLYSRYTLGELLPPIAIIGPSSDDPSRVVPLIKAALQVAGNAAIDAFFQGLINWIIDPNVKTLDDVYNSISWVGAAWEGACSLIPWDRDKAVYGQVVFEAATKALVVVVDKSNKYPSSYTASSAIQDFISGFGASAITEFLGVHPKVKKFTTTAKNFALGKIHYYISNYPKFQRAVTTAYRLLNTGRWKYANKLVNHAEGELSVDLPTAGLGENLAKMAASDGLVATNQVTTIHKKFWRNHQTNCTSELISKFGADKVGSQIYAKIETKNGQKFTCIFDNVVFDEATGKYFIYDAKSRLIVNGGTKKQLSELSADQIRTNASTKNQIRLHEAMMGDNLESVELYGLRFNKWKDDNGDISKSILDKLDLHIRFLVNDLSTDGYNIWEKVWP